MKSIANQLLEEVTDLLIEKGCSVNKSAMIDLAIYIIEREKAAIESVKL